MNKQIELLQTRRLLPLFLTQTLGSFNDNLFKSAFVMAATFGAASLTSRDAAILAAVAAAALIAPFFVFSATGGELADRFERGILLRVLKGVELAVATIAAAALLSGHLVLSLACLFALGAQAAVASPVKYALLPQHLPTDELVDGNALIEAGTFLAILFGTIAGGLAVTARGLAAASVLLVGCALIGFVASFFVPEAPAPAPALRLSWNLAAATAAILRQAHRRRDVWLSILGASWFWLVGAVLVSQLPAFAKSDLRADSGVVVLFLAAFSIGVGIGSSLCGRLMQGEVSARYVPLAAFGMAAFSLDLAFASRGFAIAAQPAPLAGVIAFLSQGQGVRIFVDLLGLAVAGGFFVVPLYAVIQHRSEEVWRARILAANNVVNALFMSGAALVTIGLLAAGIGIPDLFLVLAVGNVAVMLWVCKLLPRDVLQTIGWMAFRLAYRVELQGRENLVAARERAVIVPNHASFLDGALVAALLPGDPIFAVDTAQARRWWVRLFLAAVEIYPMDPSRPMATKSLVKAVREGRSCVIFPEGRINLTGGALMKVYDGPALIADKAGATIVPVRLDGVEFTPFSRLSGRLRRHWFPKVVVTVLAPRRLDLEAGARGRARRHVAGIALYDIMSEMMARRPDPPSLFAAFLEARRVHGGGARILDDPIGPPLSYDQAIAASLTVARALSRIAGRGERIGLMLPNSIGAALTFLAAQANGSVPAMINYSAGPDAVLSGCRTAKLRRVICSRRFVEAGKLEPLVKRLAEAVEIVWLEDIRARLTLLDRLYGVFGRRFAARRHRRLGIVSRDPAVVLFTSGSEGVPKAVALSHANLLANRRQIASRVDFSPADLALNVLPIFHAFGLTGGLILPLLSGVPVFLYPSPLHYRIVPEIAYQIGATILFGTDTFLAGYARRADPYDFYKLRYVFAGAEAVREETRLAWAQRFGKRLLEGYGVTECAPVVAVNTPMHFREGTVGRLLPLIEARLDPVPGLDEGGRLFIRGPNVMAGYLRDGEIAAPEEGWYDTGDIVAIDADGFVTIKGRAKRFAKIGGEMVSLAAAERIVEWVVPDAHHAVIAVADPRRGEKLVLVTEARQIARTRLAEGARRLGLPEIALPREIVTVDELPLLGSGKTDYPAVSRLVQSAAPTAIEPEPARPDGTDEEPPSSEH